MTHTPILPPSSTEEEASADFVAISAGNDHSLALLSNGALKAWGRDNYGQVSGTPLDNNFVAISCGSVSNLALRVDGTIVGWGYNHDGVISGIPEGSFVAIALRGGRAVALKADGSIVQWPNAADPAVEGPFIAISDGAQPIGIALEDPFNYTRPTDTARWAPEPDGHGLLDKETNLIWGFGANEVNHYLTGSGTNMSWSWAQSMPILTPSGASTPTAYSEFSNKFFTRNDTDWRLPTLEEMQAANSAGLVRFLDASPRPGFQRLGYIGSSSLVGQCWCCSSTLQRKNIGWWLNFETGETWAASGSFLNYIPVRPGPAVSPPPTDGGGKGGGGKK